MFLHHCGRAPWPGLCAWLLALCLCLVGPAPAVLGAAGDAWQPVLERTAAIRGLPIMAEVPVEFRTREQVLAERRAAYDGERARAAAAITQKLLVELGLLEPDQDLGRIVADRTGSAAGGFYSSRERKMIVVSDSGPFGEGSRLGPREELILAHEFTHALQDQSFDLRSLASTTGGDGDKVMAFRALVEGDARLTDTEYVRTHMTAESYGRYMAAIDCTNRSPWGDGLPLVVRDELSFPYCEGTRFVRTLHEQGGGFAAVNQAFADLPTSTEQILHPDKYAQREQPVEVQLPDLAAALGDGWAVLRTDSMGELDLRILLQQYSDRATAATGAAGWAGGRYALLESTDGTVAVALRLLWDTPAEADEFARHYLATLERRFRPGAASEQGGARRIVGTPGGRAVSVARSEARVDVAVTSDRASLDRLAELLRNP